MTLLLTLLQHDYLMLPLERGKNTIQLSQS